MLVFLTIKFGPLPIYVIAPKITALTDIACIYFLDSGVTGKTFELCNICKWLKSLGESIPSIAFI